MLAYSTPGDLFALLFSDSNVSHYLVRTYLILAGRWRADLGICSWVEGVLCLPAGEGEWDRCAEKFELCGVVPG
jgi:hypothetical protein